MASPEEPSSGRVPLAPPRVAPSAAGRRAADEAALHEAKAFRPNAQPLVIAVAINVVLAGLCLGVPYHRGQARAEQSLEAFARAASCVIGGTPQTRKGLALPPGERSHFADQVLNAAPSWPSSCVPRVRAIVPDDAVFLWPSFKTAAGDVEATAALLERELMTLDAARKRGVTRVPERPLLALGKLRAALTLMARAASVNEGLDTLAIELPQQVGTAEPSRIPIMAGETATLDLWLHEAGLSALALDGRGLSWLVLDGGTIDRIRVKRSALLRGTLRTRVGPAAFEALGVLAMPTARCETQEDHCAHRATGLAVLDRTALERADQTRPLSPQWLAAHPAFRFDRSVRIDALHAEVLALDPAPDAPDGALVLRRFMRAVPADDASGDTAQAGRDGDADSATHPNAAAKPPTAPLAEWAVQRDDAGHAIDALLLHGPDEPIVALASAHDGEVRAELQTFRTSTAQRTPLGRTAGAEPWIAACTPEGEAGTQPFVAFGSEQALTLLRLGAAVTTTAAPPQAGERKATAPDASDVPSTHVVLASTTLAGLPPSHEGDPRRDPVQLRCDGAAIAALSLSDAGELRALWCEASRCEQALVARDVNGFDAAIARASGEPVLVVALARKQDPSIALTTITLGQAPTPLRVWAGCWEPSRGMCGIPTLAARGANVVLAAREGGDLRVLESRDAGASFDALESLSGAGAATNHSLPMDQHRMRKGLEK